MTLAPTIPRRFAAFLALALLACETSTVAPSAPDAAATAREGAGANPPPSRSEACRAQDTALAEIVATTRKSPVAVLAVTNEGCGTSVYTASASDEVPEGDALYRVGSVTKTYVAAATLLLAHEGKLALSDRVSRWVPGFPILEKVTVAQLLDHTSGIPSFTQDPDFPRLAKQERTPREIVEKALGLPVVLEPGQGFSYSNTNYTLLGMVLEAATGEPVLTVLRSRILVPLALDRTFLDGAEALPEPLVPGRDVRGRDVTFAEHPSNPWTAGAIAASAGDVSRFHQALFGGGFLPPDSQRALVASPVPIDGKTGYGLGVFVYEKTAFGRALGHGGDIEGFHTSSTHYVDQRTTITTIVTQDGVDPAALSTAAARALF